MQVLLSVSEEDGLSECLGVIPGTVRRLPQGLKVPHMGWNQVKQRIKHPIFNGIPDGAHFYFVHSYYADPDDTDVLAGTTEYGVSMCSVIVRDNVIATQFHPEKSGELGLRMYDNFLKMAGVER
jgi:glutamine amidotransferase